LQKKSSIICDMNSRFLGGPAVEPPSTQRQQKKAFENSTATSFLIFTRPHRQSKRELLTLWIYFQLQFLIFIQLFINGQFFHRTKVLVYIFTSNNNNKRSERQHKKCFLLSIHTYFHLSQSTSNSRLNTEIFDQATCCC
jgi:hypothetical protein